MPLDDLRGALHDLAARVDAEPDGTLDSVRARGARSRARRTRAMTVAVSAVVVVIIASGVALVKHRQPSSPAVGAGASTTAASTTSGEPSTSTPPTTSGVAVCSQSDLDATGPVAMPTPTRITTTRAYPLDQSRLDPPPAGVQPKVTAASIWAGLTPGSTSRVASYELVLTSYSAFTPATPAGPEFWHRLMWVVIGHHVPVVPNFGTAVPRAGTGTTTPRLDCFFGTVLALFDANTGRLLELTTVG